MINYSQANTQIGITLFEIDLLLFLKINIVLKTYCLNTLNTTHAYLFSCLLPDRCLKKKLNVFIVFTIFFFDFYILTVFHRYLTLLFNKRKGALKVILIKIV